MMENEISMRATMRAYMSSPVAILNENLLAFEHVIVPPRSEVAPFVLSPVEMWSHFAWVPGELLLSVVGSHGCLEFSAGSPHMILLCTISSVEC